MDTYKLVLNADSKHNFWLKINILCAAVTHSILFKKVFFLLKSLSFPQSVHLIF